MANEATLRQRWDDVFHDSPQYHNAQMQAAVRHAILKSQIEDERNSLVRNGAGAQDMANFMLRSQYLLNQPDPVLRGMQDYQDQRVADYVTQTRARGLRQLADLRTGDMVAVGPTYVQQLRDPDFSNDHPWATVRSAVVYPNAEQQADVLQWMKQQSAANEAAATKDAEDRAQKAQAAKSQAYDAAAVRVRRQQDFLPKLPADLQTTYGRLTPEERTRVIDAPPEQGYAMLAGSSLRPRANLHPAGMGMVSPGKQTDFLESPISIPGYLTGRSMPGSGAAPTPAVDPATRRPKAELVPSAADSTSGNGILDGLRYTGRDAGRSLVLGAGVF